MSRSPAHTASSRAAIAPMPPSVQNVNQNSTNAPAAIIAAGCGGAPPAFSGVPVSSARAPR